MLLLDSYIKALCFQLCCRSPNRYGITNHTKSTQIRVPLSFNHLGMCPLDNLSADVLCFPGIWFGEIFSVCFRLKISIAAKIWNPIPAEHLPFRN